jgi:hypothetical protein
MRLAQQNPRHHPRDLSRYTARDARALYGQLLCQLANPSAVAIMIRSSGMAAIHVADSKHALALHLYRYSGCNWCSRLTLEVVHTSSSSEATSGGYLVRCWLRTFSLRCRAGSSEVRRTAELPGSGVVHARRRFLLVKPMHRRFASVTFGRLATALNENRIGGRRNGGTRHDCTAVNWRFASAMRSLDQAVLVSQPTLLNVRLWQIVAARAQSSPMPGFANGPLLMPTHQGGATTQQFGRHSNRSITVAPCAPFETGLRAKARR